MKIEDNIKKNILLAPFTTFKIGGPAKFFMAIETKEELKDALSWAKEKGIKSQILGGFSNVLVSGKGFDGLIIKFNNKKVAIKGSRLEAEAGADLSQVVNTAIGAGLTGLEWAMGIPGSIGGALRGNAGAFGSSISDNLEMAEIYNRESGKFSLLSHKDCHFCYRHSIFKNEKNPLVWKATFKLKSDIPDKIKESASAYLNYRLRTQPKLPSAGCIFKNLETAQVIEVCPQLYEQAKSEKIIKGEKISSGWVIKKADLGGKKVGGAKVSLEHNNFIVNSGDATADDVVILIGLIKQKIKEKFNLNLQAEIELIGF